MDRAIIEQLTRLTEEERSLLRGQAVDRETYTTSQNFIINSAKLLEGASLDLRPHTRFVNFPEHSHDYMELMYVYEGSISHIIGKENITLKKGDILFLNRHIRHSVLRANEGDIGINFILSADFLHALLPHVQNNPIMSDFLINNIEDAGEAEYLYFRTSDTFPIRNLMDNFIYAIVNRTTDLYAGLAEMLFSYLAHYRDTLVNALRISSPDTKLRRAIQNYLESNYPNATLQELAQTLGYAPAYLSRRIRTLFCTTFRSLLQECRMQKAALLLTTTSLTVEEIALSVGYENASHFYTLFCRQFSTTPHRYRKQRSGYHGV